MITQSIMEIGKDLQNSVVVVSIASLIIALIVFLMDLLFNAGMNLLFPAV